MNGGKRGQAPHPIEAMCLKHRRACYWSAYERAWCHTDGWPCPASASGTQRRYGTPL